MPAKAKAHVLASNAAQNNQTGENASASINKTKRQHNRYKLPSCSGRMCNVEKMGKKKKHAGVGPFSFEHAPGSLLRKVRV